ncbi:hypothetical protein EDB81DRAFT_924444 [Dactylonectria macrodidyma]|uniref:Uncharacterized protein n=1 Tax=Dactylonectria macrodidyma TaxID=307937 RepID=A0A9P9FFW3_9HYPO|nr:hypothetical protein EDB81DRAFT_924444 [Dactylonectria macrodidyma]
MMYHVQTGPWRNYYQPWYNQYIWTVSDTAALVLTAIMGAVISVVGSRAWVVVRGVAFWCFRRRHRPWSIGIPLEPLDELDSNPTDSRYTDCEPVEDFYETDISQTDAMLAWMGSRRKNNQHHKVRYFLGLTACVWALFCVALSAAVVFVLTSFGQETPTVQSGWTPCCGRDIAYQNLFSGVEAKEAERYVLGCKSDLTNELRDCNSFWAGEATPEVQIRNIGCPFDEEICSEEHSSISFQHTITASSLGYNTPYKVNLHHRLTCAPLELSTFIWSEAWKSGKHLLSVQNLDLPYDERNQEFSNYRVWLETVNGPNKLSSNYSGWNGRFSFGEEEPYPRDMSLVLIPSGLPANLSFAQRQLDRRLRHENATIFVLLILPGQNVFRGMGPMADRMFRASRQYGGEQTGFGRFGQWLPDREVNGIGCAEQYKLCADGRHCSGWRSTFESEFFGDGKDVFFSPGELTSPLEGPAEDQVLLFLHAFKYSSVFGYLLKNRRLLMAAFKRANSYGIVKKDQWIEELRGLFDAAFIRARFTLIHRILKVNDDYHCADNPNIYNRDPFFCRSLLLPGSEYTNINLVYLAILLLISIGVLSYSCYIEGQKETKTGAIES